MSPRKQSRMMRTMASSGGLISALLVAYCFLAIAPSETSCLDAKKRICNPSIGGCTKTKEDSRRDFENELNHLSTDHDIKKKGLEVIGRSYHSTSRPIAIPPRFGYRDIGRSYYSTSRPIALPPRFGYRDIGRSYYSTSRPIALPPRFGYRDIGRDDDIQHVDDKQNPSQWPTEPGGVGPDGGFGRPPGGGGPAPAPRPGPDPESGSEQEPGPGRRPRPGPRPDPEAEPEPEPEPGPEQEPAPEPGPTPKPKPKPWQKPPRPPTPGGSGSYPGGYPGPAPPFPPYPLPFFPHPNPIPYPPPFHPPFHVPPNHPPSNQPPDAPPNYPLPFNVPPHHPTPFFPPLPFFPSPIPVTYPPPMGPFHTSPFHSFRGGHENHNRTIVNKPKMFCYEGKKESCIPYGYRYAMLPSRRGRPVGYDPEPRLCPKIDPNCRIDNLYQTENSSPNMKGSETQQAGLDGGQVNHSNYNQFPLAWRFFNSSRSELRSSVSDIPFSLKDFPVYLAGRQSNDDTQWFDDGKPWTKPWNQDYPDHPWNIDPQLPEGPV